VENGSQSVEIQHCSGDLKFLRVDGFYSGWNLVWEALDDKCDYNSDVLGSAGMVDGIRFTESELTL
jgi:hypothetical protein